MGKKSLGVANYLKDIKAVAEQQDPVELALAAAMMACTGLITILDGQETDKRELARDLAELATMCGIKLGRDRLDGAKEPDPAPSKGE